MGNKIIPFSPVANFIAGNSRAHIDKITTTLVPKQNGTGEPSPTNIRPLTVWTGAEIYQSGADTSDPTVYQITFPNSAGTVGAGTLDVTNGILTVTHGVYTITENQSFTDRNSNQGRIYFRLSDMEATYRGTVDPLCYCNSMPKKETTNNVSQPLGITVGSGNGYVYIGGINNISGVTDLASFKTWLASNNIVFTYQLATPVEYELTPLEVSALLGENNIWTNTGEISVEYNDGSKIQIKLNSVDVTDYFTPTGCKVAYQKVQGGNGGVFLTGEREEDILAWKAVVTLTCMPLTLEQQADFLTKVTADDPTLYYFDPRANAYRSIHYMASISETTHKGSGGTGTEYWTGLVLTAEEK